KSAPPDLRRGARRATAESAAELDVSRVRVAAGARRLAPAGVPVDPGPVDLAAVPAGRDGADVLVGVAAEALADRGHGLAVDAGGTDQARLGGGGGGAHGAEGPGGQRDRHGEGAQGLLDPHSFPLGWGMARSA